MIFGLNLAGFWWSLHVVYYTTVVSDQLSFRMSEDGYYEDENYNYSDYGHRYGYSGDYDQDLDYEAVEDEQSVGDDHDGTVGVTPASVQDAGHTEGGS